MAREVCASCDDDIRSHVNVIMTKIIRRLQRLQRWLEEQELEDYEDYKDG